jgi:carbon-monoxide dehydrogenase large subunit
VSLDADRNGIGKSVPRREDERLLTGKGRYSDDATVPGMLHACFLRAPHAHARLVAIDSKAAVTMPGVAAILTGADYAADGLGAIPHPCNPLDLLDPTRAALSNRNGAPFAPPPHLPFAVTRVRHVGEPVALVLAATASLARDAAEAIAVTYEPLPALVAMEAAVAPGAPLIWDEAPANVAIEIEHGDASRTRALLQSAPHVIEMALANPRVSAVPMEPRSALVECTAPGGRLTLTTGTQGAVFYRDTLARMLAIGQEEIRVVSRDVGGAFGIRHNVYPEHAALCWAARRLGRSLKWQGDRSEAFLADLQGRDFRTKARFALDRDGRFLALEIRHLYNLGAYAVSLVPLNNTVRLSTGCYRFESASLEAKAVFTNTVPTAPYRGAGRPEAIFDIERLIDRAAAEFGFDRIALRRRNIITASELPTVNALGLPIADVDPARLMEAALAKADWAGFAARRAESETRGRLRGIGLANYLETPTGALREQCAIAIDPAGAVVVTIGSGASGQGHETTFTQIASTLLGIETDAVRIVTGDTDLVAKGGGSHSCRTTRLGGTLLAWAAEDLATQGKALLARLYQQRPDAIGYSQGCFLVPMHDGRLDFFAVARLAAEHDLPPLRSTQEVAQRLPALPSGTAICELEIDSETGRIAIVDYVTVDDVGRVISPLLVDGQVHGGIAQGVGQALLELCAWDAESGQLLTGSFMDYAMPRAGDLPFYRCDLVEIPASNNPLGIKGAGESGTTPAPAAVINALVDALSACGVRDIEMPATPERVWQALRAHCQTAKQLAVPVPASER